MRSARKDDIAIAPFSVGVAGVRTVAHGFKLNGLNLRVIFASSVKELRRRRSLVKIG